MPPSKLYTLRGHEVVEAADFLEAADLMSDLARRTVRRTRVGRKCEISTVFLSIDHNFTGHGPPIVFETLVMGGALDGEMQRYATWAAAVEGHEVMVERVRGSAGETTQKRKPKPVTKKQMAELMTYRRTWHQRILADDEPE